MSNSLNPRPADDRMPVPTDWEVVCVTDPDGLGADFAYTVGLVRHGVPELHMWARPPDGHDPGADWKWSARDLMSILNHVGRQWLVGEIGLGDEWSEAVDQGLSTVRFQLYPAGLTPALDTFVAAPGSPLVTVRWSLERELPTPERWPVDEDLLDHLHLEMRRLERATEERRLQWGASGIEPDVQPAGVWTELLDRYRAVVLEADDPLWLDVLENAWVWADRYRETHAPIVEMARRAGRADEVRAAFAAARLDAEQLCWTARRILDDIEPEGDSSCYAMSLRHALEAWLSAAYAAVIVADLRDELPDGIIDVALGWLRALADPEWATLCFEIEVATRGQKIDAVSAAPASAELNELLESLYRCSICTIEAMRQWIGGCARAAARGVGAPLMSPVDMGLRLLERTGDLHLADATVAAEGAG